ncbi:MAG: oxidoreductase [Spirochaetaceae bacterium 4572_59]|nr:MAG: oxidoreductase [Spirochaetaceae bacterium 4572_59]
MKAEEYNPALNLMGRRIRLAVIGGGPASFIGGMHRKAARLSDCYDIVAGTLSSDPKRSLEAGKKLGLSEDRIYGHALELITRESQRSDGADVVAIMTPNDSHYEYAMAALDAGLDVICDKPMTNTLEEAISLHSKVLETGLVFCLTHNYTGYPMVRQARGMVEEGDLGEIRLIQVEYVQGGKARGDDPDPGDPKTPWRYKPEKGGPSLVMGDIGTHAHNLLRYISCLEITEVAAEAGHIVPGRVVDDYTGALLRLSNGARGSFWVTQAAAGMENSLKIRLSGTRGTLEWEQETPHRLIYKPLGGPWEIRTPGGSGSTTLGSHSTQIAAGHPEGFPSGFANIYRDAAEAIAARRSGKTARKESCTYPKSKDGLAGVFFVKAVLDSSEKDSHWTRVPFPE